MVFETKIDIFGENNLKKYMLLDNRNKWLDIVNNQKYVDMRNKILNSFNELVFIEDGHKYYLHDKELISVTTLCHKYQDFDRDKVAQGTFKRNYNNPKSKYYKMSLQEILDNWTQIGDEASTHGSQIHLFGESCFYYMIGEYSKIPEEYKDRLTEDGFFESKEAKEDAIVLFFNDLPKEYIAILAEARVYTDNYAGTFDILFYYDCPEDETKSGYLILDYKTNSKDLYDNYQGKRLLHELKFLKDTNVNLYTAQLCFYQKALEDIGLKIIGRRLIWLKDNNGVGEYEKIPLKNLTKILNYNI